MSLKRVLVVAGSPVVRAGLESLLARIGDYMVLGAASLPIVGTSRTADPDVIILAFDGEGEAALAREMADQGPGLPPVLAVGEEPVADWGPRALRLGARAVLSHASGAAELAAAIEAIAAGLFALPPELVGVAALRASRAVEVARQPLTAREIEVLGLLAAGLGNKTIAARLGISEHTVKTHVTSVYAKLGVSNRAEAVAVAVRDGVLML